MNYHSNHPGTPCYSAPVLHGRPLELDSPGLRSLAELFQHLESLASTRTQQGAGGRKNRATIATKDEATEANAGTSVRELRRALLKAAQTQTAALQMRVEAAQFLVLINDRRTARTVWEAMRPDFKTPILELNFFLELGGSHPDHLRVGGRPLDRHWDTFEQIRREIERLLRCREDMLALSDALEQLIPWLQELSEAITTLYDVVPSH